MNAFIVGLLYIKHSDGAEHVKDDDSYYAGYRQ